MTSSQIDIEDMYSDRNKRHVSKCKKNGHNIECKDNGDS